MKWIRNLSIGFTIGCLVLLSALPSAFAYAGGLLDKQSMNIGTDINTTAATTKNLTDGTTSTSQVIQSSTGNDTFWYEFNDLKKIDSYKYVGSANTNLWIKIKFFDSNGVLMYEENPKAINGTEVVLNSSINNVKKVALVNTTAGTAYTIYEFDVFGSTEIDTTPPSNVNAVQYSSTEDAVSISWTNPTDSDFEKVLILDGEQNQMGEVIKPNNTFVHSGLTEGTRYTYTLVSVDTTGNQSSGYTFSTYTLAPDLTPPAEVTNIQTNIYDDRMRMTWVNPPDSDFIEVRIFKGGVLHAVVTTPATQFTDYDLTPNTTYSYLVRSRDTSGNISSGVRTDVTTTGAPDVPSFLNGSSKNDVATLSWGDTSGSDYNFTGYNIYQDGVKINITPITTVVHQISGLTFGQTYKFKVSSIDDLGNESGFSQEVTIIPKEMKIPIKPMVKYTAKETSLTLNWNPVDHAEMYKIYRIPKNQTSAVESIVFDIAYAADPEIVAETEETSYTIENPDYNSDYAVSAMNEMGESEMATISPVPSKEAIGDMSVPITGADVIINTIMLVGSLASIILLALCIYFAPRLIDVIKKAAS